MQEVNLTNKACKKRELLIEKHFFMLLNCWLLNQQKKSAKIG
jgi:hypothetical protein